MITLVRQKPERKVPVTAIVRGWSDTHVLFDMKVGDEVTRNMSRPIKGFMVDYGLA